MGERSYGIGKAAHIRVAAERQPDCGQRLRKFYGRFRSYAFGCCATESAHWKDATSRAEAASLRCQRKITFQAGMPVPRTMAWKIIWWVDDRPVQPAFSAPCTGIVDDGAVRFDAVFLGVISA